VRRVVSSIRYLVLLGVIGLGLISAVAFLWGLAETVVLIVSLAKSLPSEEADKTALVGLLRELDIFLIAAVLVITALSLYELFIGDLDVPDGLIVRDVDTLKGRVIGIVVVVLGTTFLEHLVGWVDPQATLLFGLAVAAVALSLALLYRSRDDH
jgi:uncharacterized membrane protein YqhA